MSHTDNNNPLLEHGKIGDRIAVVLNGKQIYKKLYKPSNPQTPGQQRHRARLAFANRLSAQLADAVNIGFAMVPQLGSMQSPRNAFVKTNWDNGSLRWDDERLAWELCPEKLLVALGPRHIVDAFTAERQAGILRLTCLDNGLDHRHAVADDQLYLALYHPAAPAVYLYEGPDRAHCDACEFHLPPDVAASADPLLAYVWFTATRYHRAGGGKTTVRVGQSSPSLYLGTY